MVTETVASRKNSKFETNVFLQPYLVQEILSYPKLAWMESLKSKRLFFVGIGTSYYAAQIAKCLWRQFVSPNCHAVHSFDFVRQSQPITGGDVCVLFSHTGAKSLTLESAQLAHKKGLATIGLTYKGSPWQDGLTYRLETCERENIGAFTKSLTGALAWIVKWIDSPKLNQDVSLASATINEGPTFPALTHSTDLVLIGDLTREWVAREVALKLQEASYLRARAFGLEEFLHGPRISTDKDSKVILLSGSQESRWDDCEKYLENIGVSFMEVRRTPNEFSSAQWLWQLFWGQRLTLDACRQLGVNPDTNRMDNPLYKKGREALKL